ncbi:transglutaminase-like domain-containing protein [Streptomyces sp. B1I3]|uniref:transglutaminase-like domain-containing protein n=1 Tax=Streptomyces sp. B1I3 TaxID=3042264 RepID=UPI0027840B2F|nr:transglutaminase-like domain-containing protein [Streptomyces sp. B1I3]MDQ0794166.1 regulator of sirC expression with transglutaminase-like and TPR domain [Streptomyces sp. B1I3]
MSTQNPGTAGHRRRFADEARAERPDLALLCLLVGAEAGEVEPGSATDPYGIDAAQIELDRLAGLLPYGVRGAGAWASALAELLGGRCGFAGGPGDYQRLESSLLQQVLRRRRGLPILLAVVWIEVARRAGAPVYGVALPGHFVVGFGDPEERVLADPFAGGAPLSGEDAELLVAGATGGRLEASMLVPARPLETVLRILNNIRAWAAARPERTDVSLWALELSLLLPSHPARLRYERAQLLVQRGDFLRGAAEMEEYAEVVDGIEPTAAAAIRHRAQAARALLN